jgi:hypothetical protein
MGRISIQEEEPISNLEDPILISWWNTFDRMIPGMSFQVGLGTRADTRRGWSCVHM